MNLALALSNDLSPSFQLILCFVYKALPMTVVASVASLQLTVNPEPALVSHHRSL